MSAEQLLALEERRRAAMLAGDLGALRALLAPDLRYTHSTGACDTRDSLLAMLAGGQIAYRQLAFTPLAVQCTADADTVSGEMHAEVLRDGVPRGVAARYLAVWLQRAGVWQLAAFQGTALPPR
ncbi:nuclear transport factor 2 family protein [Pseudorhodoferax sp. LjRoot39]|uniref:nuclear transport factor 2 family protein n=1 Tax=Pseudorhodoferax sp. LjRoot39 TaxID=3342328 RepID=UPI003ECCEEAF